MPISRVMAVLKIINLISSCLFTVDESLVKFLHHVDVGSVANISDIYMSPLLSALTIKAICTSETT